MKKIPDIFKTHKPIHQLVAKYVDYYYVDIKPTNELAEFICFPHFNNTISLYKSHKRIADGTMVYDRNAEPFQIFTPVRENVLHVKQVGKVHRIVIIFNPLGIQQFYNNQNFTEFITDFKFLTNPELKMLFETKDIETIPELLDQFLLSRYTEYKNNTLNQALQYIFHHDEKISVEELAEELQINRRHLTRIFKIHFGISVKKFQDIVLFRKILEHKLFENSNQSFTSLAYEYNFSDQAHLNKTFEKFTTHSPIQFFTKGTLIGKDTFWHLLK